MLQPILVHGKTSMRALALLLLLALSALGCSLASKSTRPSPGERRNLSCALEYRPDPEHPEAPDVLFLAAANPFKTEQVHMSLPDGIVHGAFAPGRHLSKPVELRGLSCEPPGWRKGHRLPRSLRIKHHLLCRRTGLDEVVISVETKWGACREVLPAGDRTPRCRTWLGTTRSRSKSTPLERLSPRSCPLLPEPTSDSPRGSSPGTLWIITAEGQGARAESGQWLRLHQTVVDRHSFMASSTHFEDEPVRVQIGSDELGELLSPAIEGMQVGERRRVYPLPRHESKTTTHPPGLTREEVFFYEFELVAIE